MPKFKVREIITICKVYLVEAGTKQHAEHLTRWHPTDINVNRLTEQDELLLTTYEVKPL